MHYKTVKLLEGLAVTHMPECAGPGCAYCEALVDVAASLTADWVAGLSAAYSKPELAEASAAVARAPRQRRDCREMHTVGDVLSELPLVAVLRVVRQ